MVGGLVRFAFWMDVTLGWEEGGVRLVVVVRLFIWAGLRDWSADVVSAEVVVPVARVWERFGNGSALRGRWGLVLDTDRRCCFGKECVL